MTCEHKNLEPKKAPDGIERPACTNCGQFVVRGELHIVMPLKGASNGK